MKVVTCDFSFVFQRRNYSASLQIFKPAEEIMFRVLAKAPKESEGEVYVFYLSKEDNNMFIGMVPVTILTALVMPS